MWWEHFQNNGGKNGGFGNWNNFLESLQAFLWRKGRYPSKGNFRMEFVAEDEGQEKMVSWKQDGVTKKDIYHFVHATIHRKFSLFLFLFSFFFFLRRRKKNRSECFLYKVVKMRSYQGGVDGEAGRVSVPLALSGLLNDSRWFCSRGVPSGSAKHPSNLNTFFFAPSREPNGIRPVSKEDWEPSSSVRRSTRREEEL